MFQILQRIWHSAGLSFDGPTEYGGIAQLARAHGSYPWCREFKSPFRYFPGTLRCFESISGFFVDFTEKVTDYPLTNSIAMSPLLFAAFKVLGPPAFEAGSVFSPFLFSICRRFPTSSLSKEIRLRWWAHWKHRFLLQSCLPGWSRSNIRSANALSIPFPLSTPSIDNGLFKKNNWQVHFFVVTSN